MPGLSVFNGLMQLVNSTRQFGFEVAITLFTALAYRLRGAGPRSVPLLAGAPAAWRLFLCPARWLLKPDFLHATATSYLAPRKG